MNGPMYGRDHDVVQRMLPEPVSEEEARAIVNLDPTDFQIFSHKMEMIALEGKETTMKLGASTGMRWGDVAFGIYTGQGDLAVCATGIWFHAALGQIPIKYILKHWLNERSVGVMEGDAFFSNDPFYCGSHGPDMGLAVPLFHQGKLIGFTSSLVHTGENGSSEPGGMPLAARSRFDEGLRIPPLKVAENYELREDVLNMLAHQVRDPRTLILDIKARLAACRIAQRRIIALVEKKGVPFFVGGLRKIMLDTAEAAKKKVAQLPDGIYRQPRFIETVGSEMALVKIGITVEKKGEKIKLSFKDTSPILPDKPLNTFFQGVIGLSMVYLCGWLFHDLPAGSALLETLEWDFPENSIVNASGDVPTALAPWVQTCYSQGMFLIGARMLFSVDPLRAVAPWYHGFNSPYFGGVNQWGEPIADVSPETNATGCGARPDMDGEDCAGSFFATMSDCSDVETVESDKPFLYLFRNYFPNHGFGKHRGGNGIGFGVLIHRVPGLFWGCFGYGSKIPSTLGVFGGYAAATGAIQTIRQPDLGHLLAESSPAIPSNLKDLYEDHSLPGAKSMSPISAVAMPYGGGDAMFVPVGGGGGLGDVLERDPSLIMDDLRLGLVTHWAARNVYKIVYNETSLRLDEEATRKARDEERASRLKLAVPFDEFQIEWLKQKPPQEILKYYGPYPHPSEG